MLNSEGKPECRCVDGKFKLTKPDANLRCNWTIGSPIDIDSRVEQYSNIGKCIKVERETPSYNTLFSEPSTNDFSLR